MRFSSRKGQVNALLTGGVSFVLAFILLTVGTSIAGEVLDSLRETQGEQGCDDAGGFWNTTGQTCDVSSVDSTVLAGNPEAYNISNEGMDGTNSYANQFSTVGLVAGAALIIGVLVGGFAAVREA